MSGSVNYGEDKNVLLSLAQSDKEVAMRCIERNFRYFTLIPQFHNDIDVAERAVKRHIDMLTHVSPKILQSNRIQMAALCTTARESDLPKVKELIDKGYINSRKLKDPEFMLRALKESDGAALRLISSEFNNEELLENREIAEFKKTR